MHTVIYDVTIITNPRGNPVAGSNNTFEYSAGTDLNLTCLVTPTPPSDSEFSWSCSTGCFADMEMEQTIHTTILNVTDSGILNCSVVVNGVKYSSESFELQVYDGELLYFTLMF